MNIHLFYRIYLILAFTLTYYLLICEFSYFKELKEYTGSSDSCWCGLKPKANNNFKGAKQLFEKRIEKN